MSDPKNSQKPNSQDPRRLPPTPNNKSKNIWFFVILLGVTFLLISLYSNDKNVKTIKRTQFLEWMDDSTVAIQELKVQRTPDGIVVTGVRFLSSDELAKVPQEKSLLASNRKSADAGKQYFQSYLLEANHQLLKDWEQKKRIRIEVIHDTSGWVDHLFAFLPVVLLIGFFWYMTSKQAGMGGGKGVFQFGKSRAKMIEGGKLNITFGDVAGCDEAKEELKEVVDFLKDPKKYDKMGARVPKGALLLGPPGTGKTLLAKAVAGEAKVPFFALSGSDFVEMFVGVGASRVRDLFESAKRNAPCIIFIDEIDAVGRQRGAGVGGGHDEREQTLNQLLVEMDGFEPNDGIFVLAATNRSDVLDKALLRPGRFDRQIVVDSPDAKGRAAILNVHVKKRKVPLADDVDLAVVAKGTPGMSGADMENLVNEAALMAARYNADKVSMIDFEEAKDKLMIGPERRSRVMTAEDNKTTAYHEAGHALVNHLVPNSDTLHKLTIIPRGMALGITFSLPEKDRYTLSKDYLLDEIAILLAGRAAEILFFNQYNSGASNDIQRATDIAYRMVTEWGMTDELGPICYSKKKHDPFLGRDLGETRNFSESTAVKIDEVVRKIIEEQMHRVHKMLEENKETLRTLAEALLEHEVLDRSEILAVLEGATLESSKKSRQYHQMEEARLLREAEAEKAKLEPKPEESSPIDLTKGQNFEGQA